MIHLKDLKLTESELVWLSAIYENGGVPDSATFKVKLYGKLPKGFTYENIHRSFIWDNRLNLAGIWVVNQNDDIFRTMDKVIKAIKAEIEKIPKLSSITAEEVSKLSGVSVGDAIKAFGYLGHYGGFWSTASGKGGEFGYETIRFSGDGHIDLFLNYKDIQTFLEEMWEKYRLGSYIRPDEKTKLEEMILTKKWIAPSSDHYKKYGIPGNKKKWSFKGSLFTIGIAITLGAGGYKLFLNYQKNNVGKNQQNNSGTVNQPIQAEKVEINNYQTHQESPEREKLKLNTRGQLSGYLSEGHTLIDRILSKKEDESLLLSLEVP